MNIVKQLKTAGAMQKAVDAKYGAYNSPARDKAQEEADKAWNRAIKKIKTAGIPKARRGEVWDIVYDVTKNWDEAQRVAYGHNVIIESPVGKLGAAEVRYLHHSCHSVSDWH